MSFTYRGWDWTIVAIWTIATIAVAILLPFRCAEVAINVAYSPSWTSATSAESRQNGLFVSAPVVPDSVLVGPDGRYRILDAWIEERTHMESIAYIFSRTVREGRFSLLVVTELPADPTFAFTVGVLGPSRIGTVKRDTSRFTAWTGTRDRYVSQMMVTAPFPDSLRFVIVPH